MSRLVTGVSAAPGVGVDGIGSRDAAGVGESAMVGDAVGDGVADTVEDGVEGSVGEGAKDDGGGVGVTGGVERSEEHTSELQSHSDLVCRLLLEKKKKKR